MAVQKVFPCTECGKDITLTPLDFLMSGPAGYKWVRHNDCTVPSQRKHLNKRRSERGKNIKDI